MELIYKLPTDKEFTQGKTYSVIEKFNDNTVTVFTDVPGKFTRIQMSCFEPLKTESFYWNLTTATGRIINDTPIKGNREQVEAFIDMIYDSQEIKAVPMECLELDSLSFEVYNDPFLKCLDGNTVLFYFNLSGARVNIFEMDYDGDLIPVGHCGFSAFMQFPKFSASLAKMSR